MKFTTFNLAQCVARYNAKHGTAHQPTHTFKIMSLGQEMQQSVQKVIESFEACARNTCGAMPTSERRHIRASIYANVQKDSLSDVRSGLGDVKKDNRKLKAYHWYETNQQRLQKEDIWADFERSAQDNLITGNVLFLKRWWRRQEAFAHYTSRGVKFVASSVLDDLESYVSLSTLELMQLKRRLPKTIYDEYSEYLASLKKDVEKVKAMICWSMLARLEVADKKGNLLFDDIIMHLAWQLESNELLKANDGFVQSPRHGLTSSLFNYFHGYILDHGSEEQKNTLLKLSWFKTQQNYSIFKNDKQTLVMPKQMVAENLVPRSVYFKRLFKYRQFRYDFFNDKLALMASLERMLHDSSYKSIDDFKVFRDYQNKLDETDGALSMMNNHCKLWQPTGLLKFFCKSTVRFINIWNDFSKERHRLLVAKQAEATIEFARKFADRYTRAKDLKSLLPLDQVYYLTDKINLLIKECTDQMQLRSLRVVLSNIGALKDNSLNESREIKPKVSKVMQIKSRDIAKSEGVLETAQSLDVYSLSDSEFSSISLSVHSACTQIDMDSGSKQSAAIHQCMYAMFIQYLDHSLQLAKEGRELLSERLEKVGKLLEQFAPQHIVERLCALHKMRESKVSHFMYQLKCESYLYSYTSVDEDTQNSSHDTSAELELNDDASEESESHLLLSNVL